MSTADHKSHHATDAAATTADSWIGPTMLFFIIGLAISLIIGWVVFPKLLYSQQRQPIDFNHALHVGEVDNGCQSCHYIREDGTFSGIPKLESCLSCHEEILGESKNEETFYNEYVVKEREVPWLVYARQPDCVFFSHTAHIVLGEMACATCHGDIGESESPRVYEENRITGYSRDIWGKNIGGFTTHTWDRMKMDECSACHVANHVAQASAQTGKGACFVCHK